jgi:hypothetical protein
VPKPPSILALQTDEYADEERDAEPKDKLRLLHTPLLLSVPWRGTPLCVKGTGFQVVCQAAWSYKLALKTCPKAPIPSRILSGAR